MAKATTWTFLLTVHCDTERCPKRGRERLGLPHHREPGVRRFVVFPWRAPYLPRKETTPDTDTKRARQHAG